MRENTYFTVGPSALYPNVDKWTTAFYQNGLVSESHRSILFQLLYQHMVEQLQILMNIPSTHSIFIASSGSEIMEKIIQNGIARSSFHYVNGSFAQKFYDFALKIGIQAHKQDIEYPMSSQDIPELSDDIEMICFTQNETSNGNIVPLPFIYNVKKKNPKKIITVDIVSSAPLIDIDFQYVDMAFFSGQKLFGIPPGLGIWIVNTQIAEQLSLRALYRGRTAQNIFSDYLSAYKKFQTPSTPNTLGVYLLGKVAEDMNRIGKNRLISEMMEKKKIFLQMLSQSKWIELANKEFQYSDTILVANCLKSQTDILNHLSQNHIVCSTGYKQNKETQIRFSNFPANSIEDVYYLQNVLTS